MQQSLARRRQLLLPRGDAQGTSRETRRQSLMGDTSKIALAPQLTHFYFLGKTYAVLVCYRHSTIGNPHTTRAESKLTLLSKPLVSDRAAQTQLNLL
ncbi:hypothetical protein [Nostoc sp.]|uniref:hypothetical protein n=1 Tax=Nostoc sp. TaxID=1180 RepID=UPI002FFC5964